jgi:hypothetical protein
MQAVWIPVQQVMEAGEVPAADEAVYAAAAVSILRSDKAAPLCEDIIAKLHSRVLSPRRAISLSDVQFFILSSDYTQLHVRFLLHQMLHHMIFQ